MSDQSHQSHQSDQPHDPHAPVDVSLDPHGEHAGHHGHTIIPVRVLAGVLAVLLFFTVLTVFASRAEIWISQTFDVVIPQLVNVLVALSIAVVKSALVAMYFMQLRYDSALNTMIFLFCLFALGLFLFFTMLDLGTRGELYAWKDGSIVRGGTGVAQSYHPSFVMESGKPIVEHARNQRLAKIEAEIASIVEQAAKTGKVEPIAAGAKHESMAASVREAIESLRAAGTLTDLASQGAELVVPEAVRIQFEHEYAEAHHGKHHHDGPALSTANRSVPRMGRTPEIYDAPQSGAKPSGGGHSGGH